MGVSVSAATVAKFASPTCAACEHTLYHQDQSGRSLGTWVGVEGCYGMRFACSVCGKFHGYRLNNSSASDAKQLATYNLQRIECAQSPLSNATD